MSVDANNGDDDDWETDPDFVVGVELIDITPFHSSLLPKVTVDSSLNMAAPHNKL